MIHARNDYNRIQDPALSDPSLLTAGATPIAQDEPVFLIRARDKCAKAALLAWAADLEGIAARSYGKGSEEHQQAFETAQHVREWANVMLRWGFKNGSKIPDAPADQLAKV